MTFGSYFSPQITEQVGLSFVGDKYFSNATVRVVLTCHIGHGLTSHIQQHLIVGAAKRTWKTVVSLAHETPIVRPEWLDECLKAGEVIGTTSSSIGE